MHQHPLSWNIAMGLLAYRCRCGGGVHFDDHQAPITTAAMDLQPTLVKYTPSTRTTPSELMDRQLLSQHSKAKVRPPPRARRRTTGGRCESSELHTAVNHNQPSLGDKSNDTDTHSNDSIRRGKSLLNRLPREHQQQQNLENRTSSACASECIANSESFETPTRPAESSSKSTRKVAESQLKMSPTQPLQQPPALGNSPSTNDDSHYLPQCLTTLQRTRDDKQIADKKDQQNQDEGKIHMPRTRKPRASLQLLVRVAASMTVAPAGEEMIGTESGGYDQRFSEDANCVVMSQSQSSESLGSQRPRRGMNNLKCHARSAYDEDEDADDEEDGDDGVWDSKVQKGETQTESKENTPAETHHLSVNYYFVPRSQRELQISRPPSPAAFRLSNGNNRFQLFDKPVIRKGCPIVSVTDADGAVKYPDDLHYYFDEVLSDDEDDDSD